MAMQAYDDAIVWFRRAHSDLLRVNVLVCACVFRAKRFKQHTPNTSLGETERRLRANECHGMRIVFVCSYVLLNLVQNIKHEHT